MVRWVRVSITVALLAFVAASVGTLVAREVAAPEPVPPPALAQAQPVESALTANVVTAPAPVAAPIPASASKAACRVTVTYFHNTARCVTCLQIERQTHDALAEAFSAELAAGTLTWATVDMEEKENRHVVSEYSLTKPTPVVARVANGVVTSWEALDEVWQRVHVPDRFATYIVDRVRAHLEACR